MAVAPQHAELNEQINAYLDGELDGPARAAFEQHLQACPACQVELEQLRATRTALQALLPLRAPRPMTITAPAAPDDATAPGGWLARWLPWTWRLGSFAAAACLLIAVVSAVFPAQPGVSSLASTSAERAVAPAGGAAANQQPAQGAGAPIAGRQNAPQPLQPAPQAAQSDTRSTLAAPASAPSSGTASSVPAGATSPAGAVGVAGSTAGSTGNATGAAGSTAGSAPQSTPQASTFGFQPSTDAAKSASSAASPPVATAQQPASLGRAAVPFYWLAAGLVLALASGVALIADRRWAHHR